MKVLLTKKFAASDIKYVEERLDTGIEIMSPKTFDEEAILQALPEADVIMGGLLTESVVSNAGHIKFAQIPWTGVDSLDFEMLNQHNLIVCNSHSNSSIVAEHAVALAFALAKKLPYHDRMMRTGNWNRLSPEGNLISPFSKTLVKSKITFIGYGAISRCIHQFLAPFQPIVSTVTKSGENKHAADAITTYKVSDICLAVAEADLVFVCAPLTTATRNLVDQNVFEAMPEDSLIINVARGAIVSEKALFKALFEKTIAGAAIDTWYQNPVAGRAQNFPSDNYDFQSLDNLVMSPHRAGYCDSGFPHLDDAIENLNRCMNDSPLINVVSSTLSY